LTGQFFVLKKLILISDGLLEIMYFTIDIIALKIYLSETSKYVSHTKLYATCYNAFYHSHSLKCLL